MNGQLVPLCEACGDEVEPDDDAGVSGWHFHDDVNCRAKVADKIRNRNPERIK